jgi:hypothetical protein
MALADVTISSAVQRNIADGRLAHGTAARFLSRIHLSAADFENVQHSLQEVNEKLIGSWPTGLTLTNSSRKTTLRPASRPYAQDDVPSNLLREIKIIVRKVPHSSLAAINA